MSKHDELLTAEEARRIAADLLNDADILASDPQRDDADLMRDLAATVTTLRAALDGWRITAALVDGKCWEKHSHLLWQYERAMTLREALHEQA